MKWLLCLVLLAGCAPKQPASAPAFQPAGFTKAQLQAQTLANALDSVEADDAERALLDIGPKAAPAVREAMRSANAPARARLQRVLDQIEPAAIN